jgi:hypothetical protein
MPTHYATTEKNDTSVNAAGDDVTFSHDSGTGDDRFLIVWVTFNRTQAHTIDGATYNGDPLTALGASIDQNGCRKRGFILITPASGSNTVAVQFGAGAGSASVVITAQTYTDTDQTTGHENYTTAQGADTGSPFEAPVTVSSSSGDLVVASAGAVQNVTWTEGSGQTERSDIQRTTDGNISHCVTEEAGAASVVMDHEATGIIQWVTMGISLIAAAAAADIVVLRRRREGV